MKEKNLKRFVVYVFAMVCNGLQFKIRFAGFKIDLQCGVQNPVQGL